MEWMLLIFTLPTENKTARMRVWRALKAAGAAGIRDGVFVLPSREDCRISFADAAADIAANQGSAHVIETVDDDTHDFRKLFNRSSEYRKLAGAVRDLKSRLSLETALDTIKTTRKLRKDFFELSAIDFFPGGEQGHTGAMLDELESAANRTLSPDEPHNAEGGITLRSKKDFLGRTWATRRRPWIDRLSSAWLIRRFIDPQARFLWLVSPEDCPQDAVGFDFDGAAFTHAGRMVSFENLAASFGVEDAAVARIGRLVHYLDVGGIDAPEAEGVERILSGLKDTNPDDDRLFEAAASVFDALYAAFSQGEFHAKSQ